MQSRLLLAVTLTFGASTMWPAQGQDLASDAQARKLVETFYRYEDECRGGPGSNPDTEKACLARDEVARRLEALNYCFGKEGDYGYQKRWDRCDGALTRKLPKGVVEREQGAAKPRVKSAEEIAKLPFAVVVTWEPRDDTVQVGRAVDGYLTSAQCEAVLPDYRAAMKTGQALCVNREAPQFASYPVWGKSAGVSLIPGAIVCPNLALLSTVSQRYINRAIGQLGDRLTGGQLRAYDGVPLPVPEVRLYGCALVDLGLPVVAEARMGTSRVMALLPSGEVVRGFATGISFGGP
jgi:hypothetical protein